MRFNVPQFIEHEAKIVGPLTFKQFIFIGTAGGICFLLYFFVPFAAFLMASIILVGAGIALAFLKIGGLSLPKILSNLLKFSSSPKMYIWGRKKQPMAKIYKKEMKTKEKEEKLDLKSAGKSRLGKLHIQIETKK